MINSQPISIRQLYVAPRFKFKDDKLTSIRQLYVALRFKFKDDKPTSIRQLASNYTWY